MRSRLRTLLAAGLLLSGPAPVAAGVDPWLGEVQIFAFLFCPVGFIPADGRLLATAGNEDLFALIGNRYGGDGPSNFRLPTAKPVFTATGAPLTLCIAGDEIGIPPPQN